MAAKKPYDTIRQPRDTRNFLFPKKNSDQVDPIAV